MTHHAHRHDGGHTHRGEAGLADLLDLDAEVFAPHLDDLITWVDEHTTATPGTIADVGSGTGTGTLALARRFEAARIVAVDQSPAMLDRLRDAARARGLTDRVRTVEADLDDAWPPIGSVDLAWAAASLHHVEDPDRLLRDLHGALTPGGLLVVVEMDTLPRFLPHDIGFGRPGLEERYHEEVARDGWNAYPNWGSHLERAGFEVVQERGFAFEAHPAPPSANRYARDYLGRVRSALADRLDADDLAALDRLLRDEAPESVLNRADLTVRRARTAWAARRP
ncbi:class I SAM-dependent methyltransferase [Nocardiopsis sp. EMB25]|uniref:class I SAM-dependent methyltransferase n=1 Tax=Nocardiopsis sp. EMB25 TaxID=2835867 RepID=UPI002284A3CF|nr:class I SAM-dependent methyltransferase [Nocardiopsis sp. EMB25]MCY9783703.1 class I SAM-dependent methyltransferase [Nocardiopsis sp. EMB25]